MTTTSAYETTTNVYETGVNLITMTSKPRQGFMTDFEKEKQRKNKQEN